MRILMAVTAMLCAFCITACSSGKADDSITEETAASETAQVHPTETIPAPTVPPLPPAERVQDADAAQHLFDECSVLKETAALEETAAALAEQYGIRIAVVITQELCGLSPDAFAAEYYHALHGNENSGFLVLINNETNRDTVYTAGTCAQFVTQPEIALAIAQATPFLAEGEYDTAVKRLLQLGECMAQAPDAEPTETDHT